jgi:hypothetical protein
MTQMTITSLTSDIGVTVVALKRLREGNSTNVTECLESELKGYLICLNAFDSAEKVRNDAYPKVIQMVQEYQRQFPEEVRPSLPK